MAEMTLEQQQAIALANARLRAQEKQPKSYTLGEMAKSSANRFFPDLGQVLGESVNAIVHPSETLRGLYKGVRGAESQATDYMSSNPVVSKAIESVMPSSQLLGSINEAYNQAYPKAREENKALAAAIAQQKNEEYGSSEALKRTVAEHPAHVLMDVSTLLGGAGALTKGTKLGSALTKAGEYTNPLKPVEALGGATGKVVGKAGNKLSNIPSKILGMESGRDSEAFNTIYQAYKDSNPEFRQAVKEATPLGKKLYKDAVYNYARNMFNLPHEKAILAEDFTRGTNPRGLGAWDIADVQYLENPNMPAAIARTQAGAYKPFAELSDAEKLKQATQAGIDTSVWTPIAPSTGQALTKGDIGDIAWNVAKRSVLPAVTHNPIIASMASPRVARLAAAAAGTGARMAGKAGEKLSELPITLDQANKLALILYQMNNPNQGEE